MTFVHKDAGDIPTDTRITCGLQMSEESVPAVIDTWARASVPMQEPSEDFKIEKEIEEKRKIAALQFIEGKTTKNDLVRPMTSKKKPLAQTASKLSATISAKANFLDSVATKGTEKKEEQKQWKREGYVEKVETEEDKNDDIRRQDKAAELKLQREKDKKKES